MKLKKEAIKKIASFLYDGIFSLACFADAIVRTYGARDLIKG